MIKWKKIGEHTPTNVDKFYLGSKETPYVSCIVWVCNPMATIGGGGVADVVRWDTKNKCWFKSDILGKWLHEPPYEITHFCDDINIPLLDK